MPRKDRLVIEYNFDAEQLVVGRESPNGNTVKLLEVFKKIDAKELYLKLTGGK